MSANEANWVVSIKGGPNERAFEIAVAKATNTHGLRSYGWFDANKLLISSSGGANQDSVTPDVWDQLLDVARSTARRLNGDQ